MTRLNRKRFGRIALFVSTIGVLAILSACGRGSSSAPAPLDDDDNTNPFTNNNKNQNPITPSPALPTNPGTNPDPGTGPTQPNPTAFSCTIVKSGGNAVATQAPQAPSMVNYLLTVTPSVTSTLQPQISSDPAGKFIVASVVPNGSTAVITGNFNTAGTIKVRASLNISGQPVMCEVSNTVMQGVPPTAIVYRFDRANPPDIFYSTSQSGPPGYEYKGQMFKVFTAPPSSATCPAIPLVQCVTNSPTKPTTFLTQYANCENYKYPFVSNIGYTCAQAVTNLTTGLMRMTNDIDFRYYATTSMEDRNAMQSQRWRYEGLIGHVPLQ